MWPRGFVLVQGEGRRLLIETTLPCRFILILGGSNACPCRAVCARRDHPDLPFEVFPEYVPLWTEGTLEDLIRWSHSRSRLLSARMHVL